MANDLGLESNIFQEAIDSIKIVENELIGYNTKNVEKNNEELGLEEFQEKLRTGAKKLSFECTKLCIAVVNPPFPSENEISGHLQDIQKAILLIVGTFYKYPIERGRVLLNQVKITCLDALQAARRMIKIIKEDGKDGIDIRYRQSTGVVWEGCTDIESLPKDNLTIVLKLLEGQNKMVTDSIAEVTEALKGDGSDFGWFDEELMDGDEGEPPCWSKEDKDIVSTILYSIKTVKMLLKRVIEAMEKKGNVDTAGNCSDLDQVYYDCVPLSTIIDGLVTDLYPPLNTKLVMEKIKNFSECMQTALKTFVQSHMCTEEEQNQVKFIKTAVEHNLNKFYSVINDKM